MLYTDSGEPKYFDESMHMSTKNKWELAMKDDMYSLIHNQTWYLVDLPKGKKELTNKWSYRLKHERGGIKRYKSRLVV